MPMPLQPPSPKVQAAIDLMRADKALSIYAAAHRVEISDSTLRNWFHRHPNDKIGLDLKRGRKFDETSPTAMALAYIAEAGASQGEAAAKFGITQPGLSKAKARREKEQSLLSNSGVEIRKKKKKKKKKK